MQNLCNQKLSIFFDFAISLHYNFIARFMESRASFSASSQIIKIIVQNVNEYIRAKDFAIKNLQKFSSIKVIGIAHESNGILDLKPIKKEKITQQGQPLPLNTDNLIPIGIQIQNKSSCKSDLPKTQQSPKSIVKQKKRKSNNGQIPANNQFVEVHWSGQHIYTQEDVLTKQIRKNKQQRVTKELKQQQQKKKNANKRQQKKKFDDKVNFGYDGQIIKIRNQSKSSLVSQILNSKASLDIFKDKQKTSSPQPQQVERTKERKEFKKFKRPEDVQFSDIRSLMQEVTVTQGVKYTHNKATLEIKRKNRTVSGIKKALSTQRLTKGQYNKIKNIYTTQPPESITNNSIVNTKTTQKDQSINRSVSQLGLSTARKKGVIHVSNQHLKETLITKINPYEVYFSEQNIIRIQDEDKKNKIKLDDNDLYNINYMTGKSKKQQQKTLQSLKLPKLIHKSDHISHPKNREKIKDGTIVMLELRKKFQEKLRI